VAIVVLHAIRALAAAVRRATIGVRSVGMLEITIPAAIVDKDIAHFREVTW
jgi:hypothetical protein